MSLINLCDARLIIFKFLKKLSFFVSLIKILFFLFIGKQDHVCAYIEEGSGICNRNDNKT